MNPASPHSPEPELIPIQLHKADFEAIYRKYWQSLYDFALSKTHDRDIAEEIVQDLFAGIWEKRHKLQIFNSKSYLFTAVQNRIIDYYREKIFADLDTAANTAAPDYPLFLDELENKLNEVLDTLPQKTRDIFHLNRLEGKPAAEISRELGLPERTVEYHITQALRRFRLLFGPYVRFFLILFSI